MEPNNGYPAAGVPPQPVVPKEPVGPPKRKFEFNFPMIANIVLGVAVLTLAGFLIYFVNQYNKAQTTVDQQRAEAADIAKAEQKQTDEEEFAERLKQPFRTYEAPRVLGAIKVEFPKNWNVYAVELEQASIQLDVFMYPGVVRDRRSTTEPYAFRIKMQQRLYTDSIKPYQSKVEKGELRAKPQTVSGIQGTRFDGLIEEGRTGTIILLPVRDKTVLIWTESTNYTAEYNQIVSKLSITP